MGRYREVERLKLANGYGLALVNLKFDMSNMQHTVLRSYEAAYPCTDPSETCLNLLSPARSAQRNPRAFVWHLTYTEVYITVHSALGVLRLAPSGISSILIRTASRQIYRVSMWFLADVSFKGVQSPGTLESFRVLGVPDEPQKSGSNET
eukprot:Gb_09521 [translate_table: standard]